MNQDNRVLSRRGARDLTLGETDHVSGGVHTLTACSFDPYTKSADGDVRECS